MKAAILSIPLLALMLIAGGAQAQESPTEGFVNRPDGARIHYEIRGTGSPMVLIHGYPLNLGLFRDNVAVLANAGYAVVTASLRGFEDTLTPVGIAREMEKTISNAELVTIDGASHAAIIEAAGVANQAILDWIDGLDIVR